MGNNIHTELFTAFEMSMRSDSHRLSQRYGRSEQARQIVGMGAAILADIAEHLTDRDTTLTKDEVQAEIWERWELSLAWGYVLMDIALASKMTIPRVFTRDDLIAWARENAPK